MTSQAWERLRGLLATLFPPVAPRPLTAATVLLGVAAVVGLTAVSLARQAGAPAVDTLWAEDGQVFLQGAYLWSLTEAVDEPYAGYLHLVPRLLAEAASQLPLELAAAAVAGAAAALGAVVALVVYAATAGQLRSRMVRAVLAALVVVHPIGGHETLNAIASSQWLLAYASLWVALWRPTSWRGITVASGTLVLAALSGPGALVVAPLLGLRLLAVGGRDRIIGVVGLAAAAVQAATMATALAGPPAQATPLPSLVVTYLQSVLTRAVLGYAWTDRLWPVLGPALPVAVALIVVSLLVIGGVRLGWHDRLVALYFVGCSAAVFAGSVLLRGVVPTILWELGEAGVEGARYAYVPALALLSAAAVVIDQRRRARRPVVALCALVLAALVVVPDLAVTNQRSDGPRWSEVQARAEQACASDPSRDGVRLPLAPDATWGLVVPCSVVVQAHEVGTGSGRSSVTATSSS